MDREKHPFYEFSEAAFFIAEQDGEVVGRIAALEHKKYNEYQSKKNCQFYHFETIEDLEIAIALFETVQNWAKNRGLNLIFGPKGFGILDGYGIQIEGFEHRQLMTMMNYNYPYYPDFMEKMGFEKEVDFVSCYLGRDKFHLPERIHSIADRVKSRGTLRVVTVRSATSGCPSTHSSYVSFTYVGSGFIVRGVSSYTSPIRSKSSSAMVTSEIQICDRYDHLINQYVVMY